MIGHTADALRCAAQATNGATEVFVQLFPPLFSDEWLTVFRSKNEVVMQAGVSGWHKRYFAGTPPGCISFFDR